MFLGMKNSLKSYYKFNLKCSFNDSKRNRNDFITLSESNGVINCFDILFTAYRFIRYVWFIGPTCSIVNVFVGSIDRNYIKHQFNFALSMKMLTYSYELSMHISMSSSLITVRTEISMLVHTNIINNTVLLIYLYEKEFNITCHLTKCRERVFRHKGTVMAIRTRLKNFVVLMGLP